MSSSNNIQDIPLPYGWKKQYHESGHPYYVDTKSNPPRSIWTHPYEDEQYLREHPDAREKVRPLSSQGLGSQKQSLNEKETRRHSYNGQSSKAPIGHKRGFFGKLKDKAIGTKEEREAEKARMAQLQEQRRQQRLAQQQAYYSQAQYAPPPQQYGNRYGGNGYGTGMGGIGGMSGMGGMGGRRTGGMGGMGGMALPLVGGMAGGLLLGEALDGFGGGGFGGGGFDNGGFNGGGFDGGGFDGGGFDNMGGGF